MVNRDKNGIHLAPNKPINIPNTSQWLAGQGAGSWFHISEKENNHLYLISRFTPNGELEFEAEFILDGNEYFCVDCVHAFTYLSHFKQCKILQHGQEFVFKNIKSAQ